MYNFNRKGIFINNIDYFHITTFYFLNEFYTENQTRKKKADYLWQGSNVLMGSLV